MPLQKSPIGQVISAKNFTFGTRDVVQVGSHFYHYQIKGQSPIMPKANYRVISAMGNNIQLERIS